MVPTESSFDPLPAAPTGPMSQADELRARVEMSVAHVMVCGQRQHTPARFRAADAHAADGDEDKGPSDSRAVVSSAFLAA
jgi:hypothetical protein